MAGNEDQMPMPIKIPQGLPAFSTLEMEGVEVTDDASTVVQHARPLRIGLLNLMPNKIQTEIQFSRLLGATPLPVELTLVKVSSHFSRNAADQHLAAFYQEWADLREKKFDGFIITGAAIETLPFEEVSYWHELTEIFRWTQTHVHSSFNICWGAQAAMYYFHGMPRHLLSEKAFGVFPHRCTDARSPYLKGFPDEFPIPVSRWMEMRHSDLPADAGIAVLMDSQDTGLCLLNDPRHYALHIFNHIEYDSGTLADEYFRDRKAGKPIHLPKHYFPGDCETLPPSNRWRGHAHLLFGNWLQQMHRTAPADPDRIGTGR